MPRHPNVENISGQRFGRLKAISPAGKTATGHTLWKCRCACGTRVTVSLHALRRETRGCKSCGCLAREILIARNTTHGLSRTPEYLCWQSMIRRCERPDAHNYRYYGGRGIKVCQRWRKSFQAFLDDVGRRPSLHHTIDRIDKDGDYSPANCRWATRKQQARNKSKSRMIEVDGKSRTVTEWAEITGVSSYMIFKRLNRGWSPEDAVRRPARKTRRPNAR